MVYIIHTEEKQKRQKEIILIYLEQKIGRN